MQIVEFEFESLGRTAAVCAVVAPLEAHEVVETLRQPTAQPTSSALVSKPAILVSIGSVGRVLQSLQRNIAGRLPTLAKVRITESRRQ